MDEWIFKEYGVNHMGDTLKKLHKFGEFHTCKYEAQKDEILSDFRKFDPKWFMLPVPVL